MKNEIRLYTDENGKMNVIFHFTKEYVWVIQVQLAEIIGQYIENIYKCNELLREAN